jgi:DNA-binding transcriptional regulator YdaS (Cro superfamily)
MNRVEQIIDSLGPGGASRLAKACSVKPQNITRWQKTGQVPAHHCLAVEQLTGISRHELRPDVFGTPEQAAASLAKAG